MRHFKSNYFIYKNNILYCEGISIKEIVETAGTPVYIYSKKFFVDRYNDFNNAFKKLNHKVFFAAKSNFNINVIKIFSDLGAGIDVNSHGELIRALKAGAESETIIFSGVGKTPEEIKLAIQKNILMIKAESVQEIHLINEIAKNMRKVASVAVRINPDVNPKTHPYISTGLSQNKFGIDTKTALNIYKKFKDFKNIRFTGIDMHIGSQITKVEPFLEAVDKMVDVFKRIKNYGVNLQHIDFGGGYGVTYNDEKVIPLKKLADLIIPKLNDLDCDIFFEPGRFLTANGGILVTRVLFTKKNGRKNFVIVDSAMNDLLRPSIYRAYHHIQPVLKKASRDIKADIVGPVCESGDFFAKDRKITNVKTRNLLAIMSAGAYSMVMSSNYNGRRRPPEVIVDGSKFFVARNRETYQHLLYDEKIITRLHAGNDRNKK
jgi:diaminopimelate decarboxylase